MTASIADIVESRRVVVCCGTGGVGKTTVAAVLAVEAARRGRDAVVVTIDPAKRLANTLGLENLPDTAHPIERARWDPHGDAPEHGRLSALTLDTKSTFDGLVARYAGDEEQARRILANRFYQSITTALSGTQEYMAMEKLYELHEDESFDLIVVDTPPTRHALDFLDAPRRLTRLLDNRVFRLLMAPTRASMKVAGRAVQTFLRTVSRVVGSDVINDVVAFFRAFEGMEEGFRDRAHHVLGLLGEDATAFVLVTSPRRDAVDEARFFARRLRESQMDVAALVVNRTHPRFGDGHPEALRARVATLRGATNDGAPQRLAELYTSLADLQEVSERERRQFEGALPDLAAVPRAYVPLLARDVYDFDALAAVGRHLFDPAGADG